MNRFGDILILGSSTIACECLRALVGSGVREVIETKESTVSLLRTIATAKNIPYRKITTRKELNAYLASLSLGTSTLIVSADNEILIDAAVIDRPGVEIINFHYGLLPDYRGMNIPSWTIYNGEKETGVTWHVINSKVDDGGIIAQAKIPITGKTTAFDVVRQTMRLGPQVFKSFINDFLDHPLPTLPNVKTPGCHEYRRRDLPAGGKITKDMPADERDRLERAWNYGPFKVFPDLIAEE